MDVMKEYVIRFSGLKDGPHTFRLDIGRPFFEHFDYGEITNGVIRVECEMEKQERMLVFNLGIKGKVRMPCDRCMEPFELPVEGSEQLIVKFGEEALEEDDKLIVIPETAYEIDLSHYLYEFIHLLLPSRRVHGEDEEGNTLCDPEMLKRLEDHHNEPQIDPRWDALKKLKKDNQ